MLARDGVEARNMGYRSIADRPHLPFAALLALFALSATSACSRQHGYQQNEDAGASGAAGAPAPSHIGASAVATLSAIATADGGAVTVTGSATFTQNAVSVDMSLTQVGCSASEQPYAVFIMQGGDCSAATLRGAHWDGARGEGITDSACTGFVSNAGRAFYSRPNAEPKPWTIGAPADSNIVGHALAVFDSSGSTPRACGVIGAAPDIPSSPAAGGGGGASVEARAQIAGLCLGQSFVRDNMQTCPDPAALASCASEHCQLDACVAQCSDFLACVSQGSDACAAASDCTMNDACWQCQLDVRPCVFSFCTDQISCAAPPSPNGPCAQLEACCAMQGDQAQMCLDLVHALERLSGDPTCYGVMRDGGALTHLPVPCKFE